MHVGLVAQNGTGKSTLLSILTGKEGYDSGSIIYRNDLRVGMLEQSPHFDPEESVLDACFNHEGNPERLLKAKQILTMLKLYDLEQPMGQLSGGQQKRVALANVLILEPDFLILDEPTNHLDLEMIEWLEGYLSRGNKTIFMVTHDRYFLDNVCNTILELDNNTIYTYRGSKRFDDKIILNDFYYNFSRFEKMGIVGNNGTGKSTFVKMLLGEVAPDSGKFDIGETVRFGYFSQEGLKFREDQKVIDIITDIADYIDLGGGKHMTASQFLNYFLFSPEQQHNYVYKLSGGEKRKLYLCTVLMKNPNFLVLDEPTNDLDIQTLQILEEYLQDFPGCVIVVSHDRYFMDKVVDHLLVFKGEGEIQDFPGNYTQFRDFQKMKSKEEEQQKPTKNSSPTANEQKKDYRNNTKRKMSFKEKREYEQLSDKIAQLEEEKQQLEEELCSGNLSVDELTEKSKRLPILKDELDELELRWLELAELA